MITKMTKCVSNSTLAAINKSENPAQLMCEKHACLCVCERET